MNTVLPRFGLVIIGDEILSGKRADKHMSQVIAILGRRGLMLSWVRYVGDDPAQITATLRDAFASGDVVFSCGGIGATPDDHTRQCAAAALGVELALHPVARDLIMERMREIAAERGEAFDPNLPEQQQRLQMGVFPLGARIVPNPYNRIPGFSCTGAGGGVVHFVPGFPVMAWPMIEQVLEQEGFLQGPEAQQVERSVIVLGALEALLTPLMVHIEAQFPEVRVFSLPSVDHPQYGRHVELGVKGRTAPVTEAYQALRQGLDRLGLSLGPELVQGKLHHVSA